MLIGTGSATEGTISANKELNNDLWIKKYTPFNLVSFQI